MDSIINLISSLFSKYKCLIYTSFGSENYLKVANKLSSSGIKYRTRTHNNSYNSYSSQFVGRVDNTQYDIYVMYEDEQKAIHAIHRP